MFSFFGSMVPELWLLFGGLILLVLGCEVVCADAVVGAGDDLTKFWPIVE